MRYYENSSGDYILSFGVADYGGEEINEERYDNILTAMLNMPEETDTIGYRLRNDLTWEPYTFDQPEETPIDEDVDLTDKAEAYDILTGVEE